MKVTKHGRYLYKLTKYGLINCYLVEDGDGLILVDASIAGQGEAILKTAADIGKPIRKIVITHAHPDHVGSVDEIVQQNNSIGFYSSERSATLMSGDLSLLPGEGDKPISGRNFPEVKTTPTHTIVVGEKIGPLVAYPSPGHSVDHFAWFDARDGTLLAGDSWQTAGGLAVMGDTRWLFPFPSLVTHDKDQALRSAKTLLDLKPSRLATGHGRILEENTLAKMQLAYARAERKIGN